MAAIKNALIGEQCDAVALCNRIVQYIPDEGFVNASAVKRIIAYADGLREERDYWKAIAEEAERGIDVKELAL